MEIIKEKKRPSFGQRFSNAVGTGLQMGNQMMQEHEAQAQNKQASQMASQMLGFDVSGLDPQTRNQLVMEAFKQQGAQNLQSNKFANEMQKTNAKEDEKDESHQLTQNAFNRIVELVPSLGRGSDIMGMFGGKTAEKSGEFTSLTGALESHLVEMVNKGTLSNTRFKYITETLLPKPTDTQDMIKGKLKGLATILNLDSGKLGGGTSKPQMNNMNGQGSSGQKRPPLSSFSIGAK